MQRSGCWSQQILDQKKIDALRKGKIAQAKFRMITGQPITAEFTLEGISSALDEVGKKFQITVCISSIYSSLIHMAEEDNECHAATLAIMHLRNKNLALY